MGKVTFLKLKTAVVDANNFENAERTYNVSASITISNGKTLSSVESGVVSSIENEQSLATFNRWGTNNLNVSFDGIDSSKYCEIIDEINTFINDAQTSINDGDFTF